MAHSVEGSGRGDRMGKDPKIDPGLSKALARSGSSKMKRRNKVPIGLIVLFAAIFVVVLHLFAIGYSSYSFVDRFSYLKTKNESVQHLAMMQPGKLGNIQKKAHDIGQMKTLLDEEQSSQSDSSRNVQVLREKLLLYGETHQGIPLKRDSTPMTKPSELTSSKLKGVQLVLASHGKLVLYDVEQNRHKVIDTNNGNYYGVFPAQYQDELVWVSRIVKVGPTPDELLLFNLTSFQIVKRKSVNSIYMHDTVSSVDKTQVFVADVAGSVLKLLNGKMTVLQKYPVFSKKEHINTIAVTDRGTIWVMLLNNGGSKIVELDLATSERICEISNVGNHAHGLVLADNGKSFIILSSLENALVKVRVPTDCLERGGVVLADKKNLWSLKQSGGPKKFLKGLSVVDGIAYFGVSDKQKSRKLRGEVDTTLYAYDIENKQLLWSRSGLGTKGIVNVIAMPFVAADSTYREISRKEIDTWNSKKQTWGVDIPWNEPDAPRETVSTLDEADRKTKQQDESRVRRQSQSTKAQEPNNSDMDEKRVDIVDSKVAKCKSKFFDDIMQAKQLGFAFGTAPKENAFFQVPIKLDVEQLQAEAKMLDEKYGFTYRPDVNNYFLLLATCRGKLEESRKGPFMPVPDRLSDTPYIRKAIDSLGIIVGRSRFMKLKSGEKVVRHRDNVKFITKLGGFQEGYWGRRFRIHIPIFSHEKVLFGVNKTKIHMRPGYAYIFDNGNPHEVVNESPIDRTHLIIDTVGSRRLFELLFRSTVYKIDGSVQEGDTPIVVPSDEQDERTDLVFEQWIDANAFGTMDTSIIKGFVKDILLPKLEDSDKKVEFKQQFREFSSRWAASCAHKGTPNMEICNSIAYQLLAYVVETFECSADEPVLLRNSSISFASAIETILREAYLECSLDDTETPNPEKENPSVLFPIRGHTFRLPLCNPSPKKKKKSRLEPQDQLEIDS